MNKYNSYNAFFTEEQRHAIARSDSAATTVKPSILVLESSALTDPATWSMEVH